MTTERLILRNEIPLPPLAIKAGLLARVMSYFTETAPATLTNAIAAHNLYVALSDLGEGQLASLHITRKDIALYAARASGILKT